MLGDLPLHPLVVHAAVVLVPLFALALILVIFVRKLRAHYAGLAAGGAVVSAVAVVAAKLTGEQLAETAGLPVRHSQLADALTLVAVAMAVAAAIWWVLQSRGRGEGADSTAVRVLGFITAALAVAALVLTALTGHTGAQAVWSASESTSGTAAATAAAPTTSSGDSTTFTLDEVAQHNTADSCWAAVNGSVYDLTSWISQHPGGSSVIENLCGTDGTAAFESQHAQDGEANQELERLQIGTLAG